MMGNRLLLSLAVFCLVPLSLRAAPDRDPKETYKLVKVEADKWATRIRRLLPEKGWTVTIRGRDIVIQRDQAVKFAAYLPNSEPGAEPHRHEGVYRIILRFGPKVSYDEYETWVAENHASRKKNDELRDSIRDIPHKFDDYLASTPDEQARLKKFREEEKKLIWHDLPDLYTTDHSIQVLQSWHWTDQVDGKELAEECQAVQHGLLRYFGMYDTETTKRDWGYFKHEGPGRK